GGVIALALLPERPIVDPYVGAALCRSGEFECRARGALIALQMTARRVGDCSVGNQHLVRRKRARVRSSPRRPGAKESDLESDGGAAGASQPAGHVPPLEAKFRMASFIVREAHQIARHGRGEGRDGWGVT